MRRNQAVLLATLFVIAIAAPARAGGDADPLGDYSVSSWNEADGLPGGRVRAIAQDGDGYLWLGSDNGLARFDGVRFETWSTRLEPRLPVAAVVALLSARDGSLWVGIGGRTPIGRIRGNQLTLYGEPDGLANTYALTLSEDHTGTVWAGTGEGLYRFRNGRWDKVGPDQGLGSGGVLAVYEDRDHRLWASTTKAVYRRDGEDQPFRQVDVISISSNVWQSFSEDASGAIWISDFREGFRREGVGATRAWRSPRRGFGVRLLHDRRGNFWIGTQGQGLWRVRSSPKGEPVLRAITTEEGLASNAVQSLFEDREGNIWVGTLSGLHRLSPHRVTPIRNLPIPRTIAATSDGSVWVGTAAGLVRFSAAGRRDYTERDGLQGSVILALQADSDGGLWISTERGVARFANGRFSPLLVRAGTHVPRVVGISAAPDGLWLRDFSLRVIRWSGGIVSQIDDVPDAFRRGALATTVDRRGALWIGSGGGAVGIRERDGTFHSHDLGIGRVVCFYEDHDGAMWVGGDDGLTRVDGGRFVTLTRQNGIFGGVKAIVEDQDGMMWIGAGNGIVRLDKNQIGVAAAKPTHRLKFRYFNSTDGVAGVPFSEGGVTGVRAGDGHLWFVTSSGVTVINPRQIGAPRSVPAPRIEAVTADMQSIPLRSQMLLPPRTSHVQIAFNALTLSDPMRVRFRYRLDGFDRDWIDAGASRLVSYTNLPPRKYTFRVAATSGDGTWSEPGTVLDFAVAPMFYQTRWFYAGCGLAVFGLVWASWRLHVRQVRRQFALILAERIRMSRAIHDTLLQGLAALALQVDDLSHHLETAPPESRNRVIGIRRQVESYIRQARRSIWDLRSPILDARDLPQALRESAQLAVAGRPVALDVTVSGTPRADAPAVDEQLLLIGQEAVNNAVHHGGASRVAVALEYHDDAVRLQVTDDGCGFDPAQTADGHYGLVSMRERAEQVRGRLTIASSPGGGTRVETVVPTA